MTTSTREIKAWGKVLTSTAPVRIEPTERWPSNSTRVLVAPRFLRLRELMPACPELMLDCEVRGVLLPWKDGRVLTKSAMLGWAWDWISSTPTTVSGVGAW